MLYGIPRFLGQAPVKEIKQDSLTVEERQVMQIILELCIEKYGIKKLTKKIKTNKYLR